MCLEEAVRVLLGSRKQYCPTTDYLGRVLPVMKHALAHSELTQLSRQLPSECTFNRCVNRPLCLLRAALTSARLVGV